MKTIYCVFTLYGCVMLCFDRLSVTSSAIVADVIVYIFPHYHTTLNFKHLACVFIELVKPSKRWKLGSLDVIFKANKLSNTCSAKILGGKSNVKELRW